MCILLGKLVFVVSTKPLAQFISLFTTGKKSSFDRPSYTSIQVLHLKISVKKKRRTDLTNKHFFLTSIQLIARALRENLSNRSFGVEILVSRLICILAVGDCIEVLTRMINKRNILFENSV